MQRIFNIISASLALSVGTSAEMGPDTGPLQLDLNTVIERVEEANLNILISREAVREALFVMRQRKSSLLPEVTASASQVRSQNAPIGQGFGEGLGSIPPANRFEAGLNGSISVFDANNYANIQLAQLGYEIAELSLEEVRQDIYAAVSRAYLTHRRNEARLDVIGSNIRRAEELKALAQDQLDAGVATQIDVTRAEVELARDRRDLLQQETLVTSSDLRIKNLLDLDLDRVIVLEQVYHRISEPDFSVLADIEAVLMGRAEFKAAEQSLDQAELAAKAAGYQRLPDVSAFASYGLVDSELFNGEEQDIWSIGLSVSVPLFEGFRIKNERLQASTVVRQRELALRSLRSEIGAELRLAIQDLRSRFAQIAIAEQEESLSRQELSLAQSRFQQGVADNRELIDAQNRVAAASDAVIEARFQYGLGRIELARVAGDVKLILSD